MSFENVRTKNAGPSYYLNHWLTRKSSADLARLRCTSQLHHLSQSSPHFCCFVGQIDTWIAILLHRKESSLFPPFFRLILFHFFLFWNKKKKTENEQRRNKWKFNRTVEFFEMVSRWWMWITCIALSGRIELSLDQNWNWQMSKWIFSFVRPRSPRAALIDNSCPVRPGEKVFFFFPFTLPETHHVHLPFFF